MILRTAWVVPVSGPPIENGYLRIDGERIIAVGACRSPSFPDSCDVLDLGDAIVTPGLINAHTHLELTCYSGSLPPAPFWEWIGRLIALRAHPAAAEIEMASAAIGAWQSLRAGVTCVGDISRTGTTWQALKHVPIRKVCFAELLSIAEQPPRTPEELCDAVAMVEEDDLLTVGISPHAPYSVFDDHLRKSVELARERGRPWCTHWAETREEVSFIRGDSEALPASFSRYLKSKGLLSPRMRIGEYLRYTTECARPGIVAHGNYFSPDEMTVLAAAGHTVAYCPRAHRFFGHSPYPLTPMRSAGVRVILATDSAASNENLSVLDEARFVRSQIPDPPPNHALMRMITIDAAAALGLDREIGTLEVGKLADLAVFSNDSAGDDPLETLFSRPVPCRAVWVAGKQQV